MSKIVEKWVAWMEGSRSGKRSVRTAKVQIRETEKQFIVLGSFEERRAFEDALSYRTRFEKANCDRFCDTEVEALQRLANLAIEMEKRARTEYERSSIDRANVIRAVEHYTPTPEPTNG